MPPFLDNRFVLAIASGVLGVILTLLTQRILNKRGLFTYFVWHSRIGMSADDAVFGTVRLTWNNNPVANLYSSTVELRNESLNDYENVIVRLYTSDTTLLTERTEIVGTIVALEWSQEFSNLMTVAPGSQPTQLQFDLFYGQREYLIPTINRGQTVRFTFLNAAKTEKQPSLWLDVQHKGVRPEFRTVQTHFWGVPQPYAALIGILLGFIFLAIVVRFVQTVWIAAVACFVYGVCVLAPGAASIKLWRWLRNRVGG